MSTGHDPAQLFDRDPHPKGQNPEPLLSCWNEIESKLADQLPGAFVDPALKDPKKLADTVHKWAMQTDQILKEADLYGG